VYIRKNQVGCQAAFASRLAPTFGSATSVRIGRLGGRHRWQASSHRDLVQKVEIGRLGDRHRELAHFYKERGVHQEESGRLSGRLREQARSHIWIGYISGGLVGLEAAIAGKPAPTEIWSKR